MTTTLAVDPHDPKTVTVGAVRWRLWESGGAYYATRGAITLAQEQAGCEATLVADTPEELHRLLVEQPQICTRPAA